MIRYMAAVLFLSVPAIAHPVASAPIHSHGDDIGKLIVLLAAAGIGFVILRRRIG
jgi:hypothetical protein